MNRKASAHGPTEKEGSITVVLFNDPALLENVTEVGEGQPVLERFHLRMRRDPQRRFAVGNRAAEACDI